MPKGSQLYDDNPRGKPRLSTLGYGTRKRAKNSIKQLKKMPRQYQLQAGTTMYYRAKHHKYRTKNMEEAMAEYRTFLNSLKPMTGGQQLSPQPEFTVNYAGIGEVNGQDWTAQIEQLKTAHAPSVVISSSIPHLLIMTDPNAIGGCFTHWIAMIEGAKLETMVPYQPPSPPQGTGKYSYIFSFYSLNDANRHCESIYFTINS
jgi:hypothetical protein